MEMTVAWKRDMRAALIEERRQIDQLRLTTSKGSALDKQLASLRVVALEAIGLLQVQCRKCGSTIKGDTYAKKGICRCCLQAESDRTCKCGKPKQYRHLECVDCRSLCKCGNAKGSRSKTCAACTKSPIVTVACSVCGNEYTRKQNIVRTTCSDACSKEAIVRSANRAAKLGAAASAATARARAEQRKPLRLRQQVERQVKKVRVCPCCLSEPITRKLVCDGCKPFIASLIGKIKRDSRVKECIVCKSEFTNKSSMSGKFCSDACKDEHDRQAGRRRAGRAKRRAMERMAKAEAVNPLSVFIRDGWCCVYCGTNVRQYQSNGYLSGDEATIDHVKPLALGGEHSYSNIVTACWNCNTKKLDSFYGE